VIPVFLFFGCGHKDSKNKEIKTEEVKAIGSCLHLTVAGISPFLNNVVDKDNSKGYVQACYQSKTRSTVEWCEKNGTVDDPDRHFYQIFKDEDCPKNENIYGKCVFLATEKKEETVVWYYKNKDLPTDFEYVKKSCDIQNAMFFKVN
jgi:hypothetical protein